MQNKFMKFGAKVTAAATMLAMFATVNPALAAVLSTSDFTDTMSRQAAGATSSHSITLTLPLGDTSWDGALDLTYEDIGAGWDFSLDTWDASCTGGNNPLTASGLGNVITVTLDTCDADGLGVLTLTSVSDTSLNDSTAGSHTVTAGGAAVDGNGDSLGGTFAVAISDDDQVTITATVDPTITFDLDTSTIDEETPAPYDVDLGSLLVIATSVSGATINSIWADLETNATGGAVVTVLNANGADGLASLSAPLDFIPSATATMAAGAANYGLCVASATFGSGAFAATGNYAAPTCDADTDGNTVVLLDDTTPDPILDTAGGPVTVGRAQILVNAAISTATPAHNDYQDVLTFVATGTF